MNTASIEQNQKFYNFLISKGIDADIIDQYFHIHTNHIDASNARFQVQDDTKKWLILGIEDESGYECFLIETETLKKKSIFVVSQNAYVFTYGKMIKERVGKKYVLRHPLQEYRIGKLFQGGKESPSFKAKLFTMIQ